jgi:hypothetical protein
MFLPILVHSSHAYTLTEDILYSGHTDIFETTCTVYCSRRMRLRGSLPRSAQSQARFHSARRTTTHDFSTQTAPIRALLGQLHALCAPGMLLFRAASPLRRILLFPEQLALICLTGGFEAALDKRVDKRQG